VWKALARAKGEGASVRRIQRLMLIKIMIFLVRVRTIRFCCV
jgi:hypothetical protein